MYEPGTEVWKSIVIACESIATVCGDWIAAVCKLLCFAGVNLVVSPYCLSCVIAGCEVVRSDLPKGCHWDQALRISGNRRENIVWGIRVTMTSRLWRMIWKVRWLDLLQKTLRVCKWTSYTNILYLEQRLLLLSVEKWALIIDINADLRCKTSLAICFLGVSDCIWYSVHTQFR